MSILKRMGRVGVNGLLALVLAGLLVAYFVVVGDLPAQVYTPVQQDYLMYNSSRSIAQRAPTWNLVQSGGQAVPARLPGQTSRVRATLAARYEEQDGVSVTVYDLDFQGTYHLTHSDPLSTTAELFFPFPSNLETLHEVQFTVNGHEPRGVQYTTRGIHWQTPLEPGTSYEIEVRYQADGANRFTYGLQHDQRSDIDVAVTVLGLTGSKVPKRSLPASDREVTAKGEVWRWTYTGLIADRDLQLDLATRLSFAQRVAALQDDFYALAEIAPLLVGLFLASLGGALYLSGVHLRIESYLLAGCGMALFYPLLTFLSGTFDLVPAAILALLLVSGMLVAFVSRAAGWRRAGWQVCILVILFLGIFSLGTLTPWPGLFMSGGGLLLIGVFMALYARRAQAAIPEKEQAQVSPEPTSIPQRDEDADAGPTLLHCPYCARALADDHRFCPGCGHDTHDVRRCPDCGSPQFVPEGSKATYCAHCGTQLPKIVKR